MAGVVALFFTSRFLDRYDRFWWQALKVLGGLSVRGDEVEGVHDWILRLVSYGRDEETGLDWRKTHCGCRVGKVIEQGDVPNGEHSVDKMFSAEGREKYE